MIGRISWILISFLFAVGCIQKENKKDFLSKNNDKKLIVKSETSKKLYDTLLVKVGQPQIIAYSLSQDEYDSLPQIDKQNYDETYSDFLFYYERFANNNNNRIVLIATASRYVSINGKVLDKNKFKTPHGFIFIEPQGSIQVIEGSLTDLEIEEKVNTDFLN